MDEGVLSKVASNHRVLSRHAREDGSDGEREENSQRLSDLIETKGEEEWRGCCQNLIKKS